MLEFSGRKAAGTQKLPCIVPNGTVLRHLFIIAKATCMQMMEVKASESFSPRQREVLGAVLDLMVEEGDGFSMAAVARRASCSKETLYKWFGDRDGLQQHGSV